MPEKEEFDLIMNADAAALGAGMDMIEVPAHLAGDQVYRFKLCTLQLLCAMIIRGAPEDKRFARARIRRYIEMGKKKVKK